MREMDTDKGVYMQKIITKLQYSEEAVILLGFDLGHATFPQPMSLYLSRGLPYITQGLDRIPTPLR